MAGEVEVRLARLGLTLEAPPRPIASFLPFRVAGGLVFLAGQTCERGGAVPYVGRVGVELDLERGKQAARQCALNLLAALRAACDGDLDRVERCVRVGGFVQAQPGFLLVPQVIDGASEVFEIPEVTQLPVLTKDSGLPMHIGLLIELAAAVVVGVCLARGRIGLELRAVGLSDLASRRAGLPVERLVIGALAASGALGGLAGAVMVQGDQHYLTAGFSSGFGFDGLVVGLLARGSAAGVVLFALLFGCLRSGGMAMEMSASVPSAIVVVCQGVMVVAMAVAAALSRRRHA